jgi:hypothetical protein
VSATVCLPSIVFFKMKSARRGKINSFPRIV